MNHLPKRFPIAEPYIGEKELNYVIQAVKSGWVSSSGEFIQKFETEFAKLHGVNYGVTTSNGTSALHLALLAIGLKQGEEVILPVFTFGACANAIIHAGGRPVFVDISEDDWNLDPEAIEKAMTSKTKAVMAVHIYGHPCKMEKIMGIAKRHGLFVIEDCAEAHGAKENEKIIGSFGHISCFSFFGNKIITTGEGGMCLSDNKELIEKILIYKNHGMDKRKRYFHDVIGYNYRMTNLSAALGLAQLEQLPLFLQTREEHEYQYRKCFAGCNAITFSPKRQESRPAYWMHSFLINSNKISRDGLVDALARRGVETRSFFPPLYKQEAFKEFAGNNTFPVAEKISASGIQLPSSVKLTEEDINEISPRVLSLL